MQANMEAVAAVGHAALLFSPIHSASSAARHGVALANPEVGPSAVAVLGAAIGHPALLFSPIHSASSAARHGVANSEVAVERGRRPRPESGQPRALGLLLRGEVGLLAGGDLAAAAGDLMESGRLHEESASATGVVLAVERLAQVETTRGRGRAARRLHRQALELAVTSAVASHLLPLVYGGMLESVDPAAGIGILDEAEAVLAGLEPCDPCSMSFHLGACAVCARTGQHDRAREHLEEADRVAGMWQGGPWHAAVAEARATLRRAEGADESGIRALLRSAAEGFTSTGRPREAARCRARLAETG